MKTYTNKDVKLFAFLDGGADSSLFAGEAFC
jgi:hypothetical protein